MKKQLIILIIAVVLICVGLSGCNEEKSLDSNTPIEGSFEIGIWFYFCMDMTDISSDTWVDYRIINLGEKTVTDVTITMKLLEPDSDAPIFFVVDKDSPAGEISNETDEILPNGKFLSSVEPYIFIAEAVNHDYIRVEITISYEYPDYNVRMNEKYEGRLEKFQLWNELTCEVPVYLYSDIECVNKYDM